MQTSTRKTIAAITVAACLGGSGWALAANGGQGTSTGTATTPAASGAATGASQGPPPQTQVTGANADTIKAAVLAKLPGATIERIEQDAQGYHAHVTKSDGTRATVRLDAQFKVTSVDAGGPGGPGGRGGPGGPGGPRPGETPLTGTTAAKVKAGALAKLPGSTVVRVETDADGAVYEAHVTKADGSPATVKFDKQFTVTAVQAG
jgi:uncharacterized membrane protein YkoI